MCEIGAAPIFTIRGLCDDTLFDRHYGWASEKSEISEKYKFQGFSSSAIFWDEVESYWKLQYNSNSSIYAICNQTECLPYPFGRKEWFIFNDEGCLLPFQNSSQTKLSFNSCPQDKFNCWDGNCVEMSQKCDGTNDCQDKSDEFQCKKIISDASYLKSSPPPALSGDSKLKVKVQSEIAAILDIVEMESSMQLQLKLTLSWSDSRLLFQKLQKDENLNSLTPEEKEIIWMPVLVFPNTKNRFVATFKNESSYATFSINQGAKEILSPMDQVDNIYLYNGIDCTITATTYLSVDFICNYHMARYPFDTQSCMVSFEPKANSDFFIDLDPIGEPTYNGTKDVLRYVLDRIQYKNLDTNSKEIRIELTFGRQLLAEFLTTILPTILIVLTAFSTNYYGTEYFEAVVTVNLTALLVMMTLFIGVSNSLPKTSQLKMIDIWMLFTLFIPFAEVAIQTQLVRMRKQAAKEASSVKIPIKAGSKLAWALPPEKKSKLFRVFEGLADFGLPLLFLVFLFIFFCTGLMM